MTSIQSSPWTFYYRTWHSFAPESFLTNSPAIYATGTWYNQSEAYLSDETYAYASSPSATQQYGNYGFNLPSTALIKRVEVGYEAYTSGDERIGITVSWRGGSNWAAEYISSQLENSDPNAITWVDFSNATDWTADKLSNDVFLTRVKAFRNGLIMGYIYVDWLPVRITYVLDPSARASVNVLIRKSDGAIRQTVATDVAGSDVIVSTPQVLTGNYSWLSYAVVDETDYLEIDYYVDVERASAGVNVFLRIDDVALTLTEQTKLTGVMLPSEHTVEVEFSGSSNTDYWSQLLWVVDSAWSTGGVSVKLELYNYVADAYSTGGDGYAEYVSSAVPDTDETKSLVLTVGCVDFRDLIGSWKVKIQGTKAATSRLYFKVDFAKYEVVSIEPPDVAISSVTCSSESIHLGDSVTINVTIVNEGETTENFYVTVFCNSTQVGRHLVSSLAPDAFTTLTFDLNTNGLSRGFYVIRAIADEVAGEMNVANNEFSGETLRVLPVPSGDGLPVFPLIFPIGIAAAIVVVSGVLLKRAKSGPKSAGFDYFKGLMGGGLPVGSSVLITGGTGSGKSILCQQLAYRFLNENKACIFVSYDNPPQRIRKSMETFGWGLSEYEQKGAAVFVDCYSSLAGTRSEEKYSVQQPFALTELSIAVSTAWDGVDNTPKALFLDSATSLFTNLDASRVIGFLQDRSAKVKADNGIFIFTLGKGTVEPSFVNRLEEVVDCIIELDSEEQGSDLKRMRIKKLRDHSHSEEWVTFFIEPNRGIVFLGQNKAK